MLRSNLCYHSGAYILVKGTIAVAIATDAVPINANKKVMLKNCVQFNKFRSRINNTQVDDAHNIHLAMPVYNLK